MIANRGQSKKWNRSHYKRKHKHDKRIKRKNTYHPSIKLEKKQSQIMIRYSRRGNTKKELSNILCERSKQMEYLEKMPADIVTLILQYIIWERLPKKIHKKIHDEVFKFINYFKVTVKAHEYSLEMLDFMFYSYVAELALQCNAVVNLKYMKHNKDVK